MQATFLPQVVIGVLAVASFASAEPGRIDSPYANDTDVTRVSWGDAHVHRNDSPDSAGAGNRILSAEVAHRFARGKATYTPSP